jgi:hypothetical protein
MNRFKKQLILVAVFAGLVLAGTMMNPHLASAAPSSTPSLVQIVPSIPFGDTESGGFSQPSTITVPATRRLIIETLSVDVDVNPNGSNIEAFVTYTSAGKTVTLFVPLTFSSRNTVNGFDTYFATQAVRLYADPGTSVTLSTSSPTGGSQGTSFLTVSGYLI